MAGLSYPKPHLSLQPALLGRPTDGQGHSTIIEPWRRWYASKRWRGTKAGDYLNGTRGRVLRRDGFRCRHDGCGRLITRPAEAIAHHVRPHRGDPVLFWDEGNLITVCKTCHDGPIAAAEAAARARGDV